MGKRFGGFTEQQMEVLAKKMGFNGPMSKFNEFVSASPAVAAKLSQYTQKARTLVEGGASVTPPTTAETPGMAKGGTVKKPDDPKKPTTPTITPNITQTSPADKLTTTAINDPQKLITPATMVPTKTTGNQLIAEDSGQVGKANTATAQTAGQAATASAPVQPATQTVTTDKVGDDVKKATEGLQGATGTVSDQSIAKAATALPSKNATVQGQMEGLMKQFEGGETPPWAAGAMRMANEAMASRGLGSSSMAGAAITQSAMESAIQIAVADASTYSAFEMKNLDNRQQAALQNAQAFLQMDFKNLDNEQAATMFKAQARIQALFSDQAAENASRQFNATSKNQSNQFFAELKSQAQQFNANQKNAMKMFDTEQGNAISTFNAEQRNARDQFNANNRLIIDQSNAKWRQQIATQDNAQANETNRLNAQLATGLTSSAYNNMWQKERDVMEYVFTAAENSNQRAHELVMQKMAGKTSLKVAGKGQGGSGMDAVLGQAAGRLVGSLFDGIGTKIGGAFGL